ncbi:MAG: hypothetical protein FWE16_03305 [Firmicutes bacterium]|nr:hypothetical protein [Bacillota bacterium]
MNRINEFKKQLVEFEREIRHIDAFINCYLPESMISFDFEGLQGYLKYLRGYIDCMINFELRLDCQICQ